MTNNHCCSTHLSSSLLDFKKKTAVLPCPWRVNFSLKIFKEALIHLFYETQEGSSPTGTPTSRLSPFFFTFVWNLFPFRYQCPAPVVSSCIYYASACFTSGVPSFRDISLKSFASINGIPSISKPVGDNFSLRYLLTVRVPKSYPGYP